MHNVAVKTLWYNLDFLLQVLKCADNSRTVYDNHLRWAFMIEKPKSGHAPEATCQHLIEHMLPYLCLSLL